MGQAPLLDADKVEALFDNWINMLIEHYGDEKVKNVLGSPAIQSCFTGDIGQWAVSDESESE